MTPEGKVQAAVRVRAAGMGWVLWRNNSGALTDVHGRLIRYGLANDSKAVNKRVKSSDLIGVGPGGRFIAIECKAPDWVFEGTDREIAQLRFITLVIQAGGVAAFVTDAAQLDELDTWARHKPAHASTKT